MSFERFAETGTVCCQSHLHAPIGEMLIRNGQAEEASRRLDVMIKSAIRRSERVYLSELYRVRGLARHALGAVGPALADLETAYETARSAGSGDAAAARGGRPERDAGRGWQSGTTCGEATRLADRGRRVGKSGLAWTGEQWERIRRVVHDEALRTRVAASFLPLYGPLAAGTEIIPANTLQAPSRSNPAWAA